MKAYNSIRLFQNKWLEKLTHVHPTVPFIIWVPIIAFLFWDSRTRLDFSYLEMAKLGVLGLVVWTFTEYTLHRFVFHFHTDSAIGKRLVFLFHGIHHDQPDDPTRLVMPPVVSLTLGLLCYLLFESILGPEQVEPFFAAFLIGYLIYDFIHFSVHHFKPRTPIGRFLKQNHMLHHFVTPEARMGVSSPIWDYVFRTTGSGKK